jgi:hypothetical protein
MANHPLVDILCHQSPSSPVARLGEPRLTMRDAIECPLHLIQDLLHTSHLVHHQIPWVSGLRPDMPGNTLFRNLQQPPRQIRRRSRGVKSRLLLEVAGLIRVQVEVSTPCLWVRPMHLPLHQRWDPGHKFQLRSPNSEPPSLHPTIQQLLQPRSREPR